MNSLGTPVRRSAWEIVGIVLAVGFLLVVHLACAYGMMLAFVVPAMDPLDPDVADAAQMIAVVCLLLSLVSWLVTRGCVKLGWLRRWWYVFPGLFAAGSVVRLLLSAFL